MATRPGDHPDFFRLPAPPGRTRESTIRLRRDGQFEHEGAPVSHPAMAKAFARWLQRHPDDGRYILNNGYDWTYVEVEDVPYLVTRLVLDDLQAANPRAEIQLSDDSVESLRLETVTVDMAGAVYCQIKDGQYEARFTPHAQQQLAPLLAEQPEGIVLRLGARCVLPRPRGS